MFTKSLSLLALIISTSASTDQSFLSRITEKIVSGEKSPIHYPYQLSLQLYTKDKGLLSKTYSHICGASIISEEFMVTAAHCIVNQNTNKLSLLAGTSNLNEENKGSRHPILFCSVHPDYVELNTSDIAVCKVLIPFVFGSNISKIDLDKTVVGEGVNCTLTGWGSVRMIRWLPIPFYTYFAYPDELQRAYLQTLSNEKCFHSIDSTQICTFTKFRQGACAGDSGGPLAVNNKLVGIVSYGTIVCAVGQPDVFTRVSYFVDWIESKMIFNSTAVNATADYLIPEAFQ